MGTIEFPETVNYGRDLNCYFKIEVPTGQRVQIKFTDFDLQSGVEYGIDDLYPGYDDNEAVEGEL